ncbi:MAG: trigger factor [Deltaproteobacteria bacterium]|nr:trigger factor [Deltaproteobacteria bacterium]
MQTSVSRLSPVEVELKVELPKDKIQSALAKAYAELSKSAQVRGFRKGKVPLAILKQYYGARVATDVASRLVDESLPQAMVAEKLDPVVQPSLTKIDPLEESAAWSFTAKLEVRPEVTEIVLEGIKLERKIWTVTDEDVNKRLEVIRQKNSTLRTPEPARGAIAGDQATIDYDVAIEGENRDDLKQRNRTVEVGKGRLLEELDAALIGLALNEAKPVEVTFGEAHPREDLRNKKATLTVTLKELRETVLPTLDDELAKDEGSESLEALKAKIRGEVEKEAKDRSEHELREAAINALVEKNPIAVPPTLVKNAVGIVAREMVQYARIRNEAFDAEAIVKDATEQAESRVRAGLLLAEMARANTLTVTDADLETRLEEMSKETGKAVARLRAEHRDNEKRQALANAVLEDKVLSLLISKIEVTEVAATEPLEG